MIPGEHPDEDGVNVGILSVGGLPGIDQRKGDVINFHSIDSHPNSFLNRRAHRERRGYFS
jgi:hypothetical protein